MDNKKTTKIITCKALENLYKAHASAETEIEAYDISLHVNPDRLRIELQRAIDKADGRYDDIYLGYAICAQTVVGLKAKQSRIILFTTDDCIGIFMGDRDKQRQYAICHPGTYFLSKGFIGDGNGTIFDEYAVMIDKYGQQRADRLMQKMLAHYNRLVYIALPDDDNIESDRRYAQARATQFNLEYLEIEGTDQLIRMMLAGSADANIAVFEPGEVVSFERMMKIQTDGAA